MINTKKSAFTLVELIVVITILAILATIAFISFQGSTSDAKNVKVKSDIANLAKKVSIVNAQGTNFSDMLGESVSANKLDTNPTIGSGQVSTAYDIGTVDFGVIQEDAQAFKDKLGHDYFYAFAGVADYSYYQVAGELVDSNSAQTAYIKGNYSPVISGTDAASIITNADKTVVISGATSDLY
jgi:prepilin-type N-terminal cleavage/methylation domain-containing protein